MLSNGSIFFPLIVAPLKTWFPLVVTYSTVQMLSFDDIDTNILRALVCLMLIL